MAFYLIISLNADVLLSALQLIFYFPSSAVRGPGHRRVPQVPGVLLLRRVRARLEPGDRRHSPQARQRAAQVERRDHGEDAGSGKTRTEMTERSEL